jgi:hypothetical protein
MRPAALPLVLLAACAGARVEPPAQPEPTASAEAVEMPRPARARRGAAVEENGACEGCHREIAEEWRASLHHRADVEPSYRRAFAIEPMAFCRGCHAPEAIPDQQESEAEVALGVGCVTCHVTAKGQILAAPGPARPAPHAVVREARFASAAACASCHEFAFPTARGRAPAELMQATVTEHRGSPASARACAACHMPRAASGRKSHAFLASRDPETLRRAVEVQAERTSPTAVRLTLAARDPGHAVPTGDLFRRLEISAEAAGPDEMSLGAAVKYLARHWDLRPRQAGRVLVRDDRLGQRAVAVELEVGPEAKGRDIVWRVAYQRVAHPNGIDARDAAVDGEITLAGGRLRP